MKGPKYLLGGLPFFAKDQIAAYVRHVLNSTLDGWAVTDQVVLDLLPAHPQWEQKQQGMLYLSAGVPPQTDAFGSRCFMVVRCSDIEDISFRMALKHLLPGGLRRPLDERKDHIGRVQLAARGAILDQIAPLSCSGYEVDHAPPRTFAVLLHEFFVVHDIRLSQVEVTDGRAGEPLRKFRDQALTAAWQEYHRANAILRVLTKEEHQAVEVLCPDWSLLWA